MLIEDSQGRDKHANSLKDVAVVSSPGTGVHKSLSGLTSFFGLSRSIGINARCNLPVAASVRSIGNHLILDPPSAACALLRLSTGDIRAGVEPTL